jgi:hypothetical protein
MKKHAVTIMDQSRKSSDREKAALRQAQEALELKETTVAEALRATTRANYMLDLMTEASQDMAGTLHCIFPFFVIVRVLCHILLFFIGSRFLC